MQLWTVSFKPEADRDISRLSKDVARQVWDKLHWLENNFASITPQRLTADLLGSYKLRVGNYRVIYELNYKRSIIYVYRIEHRSKVYKK